MSRFHAEYLRDSSQSFLLPGVRAFTLVEILISIMILALGVLGLGVLFPVVIREQRMGVDASTGIVVAGAAKDILSTPQWGRGLPNLPVAATVVSGGPPPATSPGACCTPVGPNATCQMMSLDVCVAATGHFFGIGVACQPTPCSVLLSHTIIADRGVDGATSWLWEMLRNREANSDTPANIVPEGLGKGFNGNRNFQPYGQGEWFTNLIDRTTGTAKIGFPKFLGQVRYYDSKSYDASVDLPIQQRLYPQSDLIDPQFVWDYAVQRVARFNYFSAPDFDALRAMIFVRRVDSRIRTPVDGATNRPKSVLKAILDGDVLPLGEDINGNPTFDGTDGSGGKRYSGIHTCEVEFWYDPTNPDQNHTDRLYIPNMMADPSPPNPAALKLLFAQMKQPGQKLVDNLGNIYTVIGSGNQATGVNAQDIDGVAGADYIRVDPPITVPQRRAAPATQVTTYTQSDGTIDRAIWSVSFTPQVPVAVTIVDLIKGAR